MKTITPVDNPSDSLPEERHNFNNGPVCISHKSTVQCNMRNKDVAHRLCWLLSLSVLIWESELHVGNPHVISLMEREQRKEPGEPTVWDTNTVTGSRPRHRIRSRL